MTAPIETASRRATVAQASPSGTGAHTTGGWSRRSSWAAHDGKTGRMARLVWILCVPTLPVSYLSQGLWALPTQLTIAVMICLTPWILPGRLRATNGFEPLPFIGALNLLYFGGGAISIWLEPQNFPSLTWPDLTWALFWVSLGWASCIAGYCLAVGVFPGTRSGDHVGLRINWARMVLVLVAVGTLCKAFLWQVPDIYAAGLAIYSNLFPVGLGFAAYQVAQGEDKATPRTWMPLILVGLLVWLLFSFSEGQREQILLPFIYMVVGYRLGSPRPYPRVAVVLGILGCALALKWLGDYKTALWAGHPVLSALAQATEEAATLDLVQYVQDALTVASRRINYLATVATIMGNTPSPQPFQRGQTYILFFWAMGVPRFLYPDKPTLGIYNDVAQRYGLVQPDDLSTSIALPPVGELYMNFGYPGIIVGMIIFGVLYRALYAWVMSRSRILGLPVLLYIALAYPLARGDIFAMTAANALKLLLGLLVLVYTSGTSGNRVEPRRETGASIPLR